MAATNPNRRCVCGFTRFRETLRRTDQEVDRWMRFDSYVYGGFGATPFGTFFGAGSGGMWGLFTSTFKGSISEVACESCGRIRLQKQLGGFAAYGMFLVGNYVVVVGSDAVRPITCYSIRLTAPSGATFEVPLGVIPGLPPPLVATAPVVTAPSPPPGAQLVDTMITAALPEITETGTYLFTLVDRGCSCETPLAYAFLEALPMIFTPLDADIGGAPVRWLRGSRASLGPQPAGSSRLSIPFDRCTVVAEYDARCGALPDAVGWTLVGAPANCSLVEGGALRVASPAPALTYYEITVPAPAAPTKAYVYASILSKDAVPSLGLGTGPGVRALYGGPLAPAEGVHFKIRENQVFYTELTDALETQISTAQVPPQWKHVGAGHETGGDDIAYEGLATEDLCEVLTPTFGTDVNPATDSLYVQFGNWTLSSSSVVYLQEIVAADGRFIRARFTGYTQVASPKLRLYMASEINASVSKTVRLLVKYGPGNANPHATPSLSAGATVNMLVANTVYEIPVDLPGLTGNQPFWFSIERDWANVDDQLDGTVHLFQATLRAL